MFLLYNMTFKKVKNEFNLNGSKELECKSPYIL